MHLLRAFISGIFLIFLFNTPAISQIVVPEGWKQVDAFVETASEPIPTPIDVKSAFIPFTRNYMEPVFTNSRPSHNEITNTFHVTLARGEYEPFLICLYAIKKQEDVHIEILRLKSQNGELSPNQFEIRKIEYRAVLSRKRAKKTKKYRLIPSLLKLSNSVNLRRGQTKAFWVTVQSLKKNVPGTYTGQIKISRRGQLLRTLTLKVTILPFVLEEIPDKTFSILYTPTNISPNLEQNARVLLRDMRAHGMTSYSPHAFASGAPLKFDKHGVPQVENLLSHLQWANEEGFWEPTLLYMEKLIRAARPNLKANYTKFEENLDVPNLKKFVRYLETERKRNNWTEIIYIPIDEPGAYTDQVGTKREEMAVLFLKTLNDLNVHGATTIADLVDNKHRRLPRWKNVVGWWEKMRPYCSVRIYQNGYPEGKTNLANEMRDAISRGHEVMLYERTSTMGIDPRVSRIYFGFYGWRTGVKGITAWTHPTFDNATISHVWADWKERRKERERYYHDENWQLPPSTICWEMVREGIDDAKYLYAFQKALRQQKLVKHKYLKLIEELKTAIDSTRMLAKKPQCHWSGQRFSYFRERLIQAILELDLAKN